MNIMEIHNATDFGQAVRAARKEAGLSQAQLAEQCGCSQRFVSEVERGKATAEIGKALRLADELGVPLTAGSRRGGIDGRAEVRYFIAQLENELAGEQKPERRLADYLADEQGRS